MSTEPYIKDPLRDVKSFAQSGQDVFAWEMNSRKRDGTFIDIGCNDPVLHNNTYALELIGWTGVCVDIANFDYSCRKSPFIQADATKIIPGMEKFIRSMHGKIDYLSLDADDATFACMGRLIPFYKFKAITVEHDIYRLTVNSPKQKIFEFLSTFGYLRQHEDVLAPISEGMPWSGQPYEDWYFMP